MKYQIHYKEGSQLSWRQYNYTHCMEYNYTFRLIKALSRVLTDEWKLILTGEDCLPPSDGHDPMKTIVFHISDERYGIPSFAKNVKAVFKHYVKSDCEAGNVYPIPQGDMTSFLQLPYRAMKDRSIDVFFSGNWHTSRRGILEGLQSRLKDKFNVVFLENNVVSMVQPTYSHYMMDSKISLDLSGALGPETFRYYESLMAGCITLSYKKPENWIYRNSPAITPRWDDLDSVANGIEKLLDNKDDLDRIGKFGMSSIEKRVEEERVVAKHILTKIFS